MPFVCAKGVQSLECFLGFCRTFCDLDGVMDAVDVAACRQYFCSGSGFVSPYQLGSERSLSKVSLSLEKTLFELSRVLRIDSGEFYADKTLTKARNYRGSILLQKKTVLVCMLRPKFVLFFWPTFSYDDFSATEQVTLL